MNSDVLSVAGHGPVETHGLTKASSAPNAVLMCTLTLRRNWRRGLVTKKMVNHTVPISARNAKRLVAIAESSGGDRYILASQVTMFVFVL